MMLINPYAYTGIVLDNFFDTLNLQSNNTANFSLTSGSINQWTDISGNNNHAVQATGSAKPTLTSGKPVFDGGDFLDLTTEISLSEFSIYIAFRQNALTDRILIGGSSRNDYFYLAANVAGTERDIRIQANSGISWHSIGSETNYNVLSVRRINGTIVAKLNDRTLIQRSNSLSTDAFKFKFIGKGQPGLNISADILAVCVHSVSFSDVINAQVVQTLYSRYNIPTGQSVACFGDSITQSQPGNYPALISAHFGIPYVNLGIAGSRMTANDATSGVTRSASQFVTKPYNDRTTLLYGTNDVVALIPTSTYISAYTEVLVQLLTAGYNSRNICIGSVPYQKFGANSTALLDYRTALVSLAATYNVRYADIYQALVDGGGDTLMFDSLHPTSAGGIVIADTFIAAMEGA